MRPKPKPARAPKGKRKKPKSERKLLEAELEAVIRELVWWRDGGKCIEADIDGARCGGPLQWGHYVTRHESRWMKLTIASFVQCRNHNGLHHHNSQTMSAAVGGLLGLEWQATLDAERAAHRDGKVSLGVLRERIERYRALYDNCPATYNTKLLLQLGYYTP